MEIRPATLRLVSWNVAGKAWCVPQQVTAIAERHPDIVALQEVRPSTAPQLLDALADHGLPYGLETASAARDAGRRYGVLLASRWPLESQPELVIPYVERVLSALVTSPWGAIEIHTAHIPPGEGNGWKKIETFEGIYGRLATPCDRPRILCGDFNSPQHETRDGELITWGQRIRAEGTAATYSGDERWDTGERAVLEGLRNFDMPDVFRAVNGYGVEGWSWRFLGRGKQIGRRFDHIFASRALRPTACAYLHDLRKARWSDHAAIEAVFAPGLPSAAVMLASDDAPHTTDPPTLPARPSPRRVRRKAQSTQPAEDPMSIVNYTRDARDNTPDRDERRRAQFHMGWRRAVAGQTMQVSALDRLTWQNLGYRLGALFGATASELIDSHYDWCVRQQAAADAPDR
jgi:exonuclease III